MTNNIKTKNFLIIVTDSADRSSEPFDQIVEALNDAEIIADVHKLEEYEIFTGRAN